MRRRASSPVPVIEVPPAGAVASTVPVPAIATDAVSSASVPVSTPSLAPAVTEPLVLAVNGTYELLYSVTARGIVAGEYAVAFRVENGGYSGTATRRSTGVAAAALGGSQDYSYEVSGRLTDARHVAPTTYSHRGGRRNRVVNVAFSAEDAVTTAEPPMGMGDPPATSPQRRGVIDNLSLILDMMVRPGNPCEQTYRVYMDGRSRFDLA